MMRTHITERTKVGRETVVEGEIIGAQSNTEVKVLFDSGANINCITQSCVQRNGLRVTRTETLGIGGLTGKLYANARVQFVLSLKGNRRYDLKAVVVPDMTDIDIVIGTGSFEDMGVAIGFDKRGKLNVATDTVVEGDLKCRRIVEDCGKGTSKEKEENSERSDYIIAEHSEVFAEELPLPPARQGIDLKITLLEGVQPAALNAYRFPIGQLEELSRQINDLLDAV